MVDSSVSSGSGWNLSKLQGLVEKNKTCFSGPLIVHVVKYEARNGYPHKFTYRGCKVPVEEGRLCQKSVRNFPCVHNPDWVEVADMFRFDVIVYDGCESGRPFNACTWGDVAEKFLGMSASHMSRMTELEQIRLIDSKIRTWSMYEGSFKVSKHRIHVQSLAKFAPPNLHSPNAPALSMEHQQLMAMYGLPILSSPAVKKKEKVCSVQSEAAEKLAEVTRIISSIQLGLQTGGSEDDV